MGKFTQMGDNTQLDNLTQPDNLTQVLNLCCIVMIVKLAYFTHFGVKFGNEQSCSGKTSGIFHVWVLGEENVTLGTSIPAFYLIDFSSVL